MTHSTLPPCSYEQAEVLALRCIGALFEEQDLAIRFLTLTGLTLEDLRAHLSQANTLCAVLDFLLAHEPSLKLIAERLGISPESIVGAARYFVEPERL